MVAQDQKDNRVLLFVDDEPNILSALKRVFFEDDFEIETFTSGQEALDFVKKNQVDLIISDQRMPGMTGTEFLARVREKNPATIRIILTGFADMDAAVEAINEGQIYHFIFKPWNDEELRAVVMRALEHYDLQEENRRLLSELMQKNEQLEELNSQLGQKVKERTALIVQKNVELGKLNRNLENSLVNTVRVFVNLMEMSRPEISQHNRRVASYANRFAQKLGWNERQIRDLEISCLLHDIGKIGIPEAILRKPKDNLAEAERDILRNHPVLAQNTLAPIETFERVGKIVRHHHERWDGKGYPDGLAKDDIPMESRMLAICNTLDHLVNDEDGRSPAFVQKYFDNNAGTLFDPNLVDVVKAHYQKGPDAKAATERKATVMPHELRPGMTLASNLSTGKGIFLLPEGQVLKDAHIRSIQDIQRVDPIQGGIDVIVRG